MSEPIKAGDLVVVIAHPCCGAYLGMVFRVGAKSRYSTAFCSVCLADFEAQTWLQRAATHEGYALSWLKRIPPLSELEGEKQDEEITA